MRRNSDQHPETKTEVMRHQVQIHSDTDCLPVKNPKVKHTVYMLKLLEGHTGLSVREGLTKGQMMHAQLSRFCSSGRGVFNGRNVSKVSNETFLPRYVQMNRINLLETAAVALSFEFIKVLIIVKI